MRPNVNASHQGSRTSLKRLAVGAVFLLVGATAAHAGIENPPTLSVIGGTGIPGGTVNVTFAVTNNSSSNPSLVACAAGITMDFDHDLVTFSGLARPPRCTVDPRLGSTHVISGPGDPDGTGVFDTDVFANPIGENSTLGNGNIATCAFNIDIGAPVGTTALMFVVPPDSFLNTCQEGAPHIANINLVNGEIVIALPTPTFTVTATPTTVPTATRTIGVSPTATRTTMIAPATSTVSATSTSTAGSPTPTHTVNATSTARATSTNTVVTSGTPTNTGSPRATATNTVSSGSPTTTPTINVTPKNTATRTSGGGTPSKTPQRSSEDDGCNIVAPESVGSNGTFALLLAPAILLWMRRRRF